MRINVLVKSICLVVPVALTAVMNACSGQPTTLNGNGQSAPIAQIRPSSSPAATATCAPQPCLVTGDETIFLQPMRLSGQQAAGLYLDNGVVAYNPQMAQFGKSGELSRLLVRVKILYRGTGEATPSSAGFEVLDEAAHRLYFPVTGSDAFFFAIGPGWYPGAPTLAHGACFTSGVSSGFDFELYVPDLRTPLTLRFRPGGQYSTDAVAWQYTIPLDATWTDQPSFGCP